QVVRERQLRFESVHRRQDGSTFVADVSATYLPREGGRIYDFFRDITARVEAEKALKAANERIERLNEELEERVAARTAELRSTVKELDAFTYSVSHDLRTPVGAINGFANLLRMKEAERLSEEGLKLLSFVESNAVRMADLVEGLLTLSRIGRQAVAR